MQKAESQHKQAQSQPVTQQRKGAASLESPEREKLAQLEAMADNSQQVSDLARLSAMANGRSGAVVQREGGGAENGMTLTGAKKPLVPRPPRMGAGMQTDVLPVSHAPGESILTISSPLLEAPLSTRSGGATDSSISQGMLVPVPPSTARRGGAQTAKATNQAGETSGLAMTGRGMQNPFQRFLPSAEAVRQQVLDDTLTREHQEALLDDSNPYLFAVRETGAGSIKRLREGAKAKPHTILEKSIKKSSLESAFGAQASEMLKMVKALDIDGFVGHWKMETRGGGTEKKTVPVGLLGVRVDGYDEDSQEKKLTEDCSGGQYVPIKYLDAFKERHPQGAWKRLLYTGDYDLHEVYDRTGKQIAEGAEKARMVSVLNALIAPVDPSRTGAARTLAQHRTHVSGQYAMFQHGDQATYVANQHNEARAGRKAAASVVAAVSRQSEEPMVWHFKHAYYVTLNRAEHDAFRTNAGLVVSQEFRERSELRQASKLRASHDSQEGAQPLKHESVTVASTASSRARKVATDEHLSGGGARGSGMLPAMDPRYIRTQAGEDGSEPAAGKSEVGNPSMQPDFLPKVRGKSNI